MKNVFPPPPTTLAELTERVQAIAGLTLGELAQSVGVAPPENLLRDKGWSGQLIEQILGASAGSRPVPDFEYLDIELKTLPISRKGAPLETTFVAVAPLKNVTGLSWRQSGVYQKLKHVLWLPILAERDIPVTERIIGHGFFWQPNSQEEALLRNDWEEITEHIALGNITSLNGHFGNVLQLRPKAANSKALTEAIGPGGTLIQTLPRGYYLKTQFTKHLLAKAYGQT